MKKDIHSESFEILLTDLKELTDTNCHGEALEAIATFFDDKQLLKAFEAINTLHITIGYLDEPIADLRRKFTAMMFDRIEHWHGERTRKAVYSCL